MGKRAATPSTWEEALGLLVAFKGQWVLMTNFGTYATVQYLRSIGARTMTEPYAIAPSGEGLETVWAMLSEDPND